MSEYVFPHLSPHQSRTNEPTDWELALAAALESAFTKGAHELDGLVAELNASRVRPREGGVWTADVFTSTMRELGV